MEEGSEETRDFLEILTDSSDLAGEDAHLRRVKQKI